ncbi:hypothetical protein CBL_04920 [Carabus blaptoides fortunei]
MGQMRLHVPTFGYKFDTLSFLAGSQEHKPNIQYLERAHAGVEGNTTLDTVTPIISEFMCDAALSSTKKHVSPHSERLIFLYSSPRFFFKYQTENSENDSTEVAACEFRNPPFTRSPLQHIKYTEPFPCSKTGHTNEWMQAWKKIFKLYTLN